MQHRNHRMEDLGHMCVCVWGGAVSHNKDESASIRAACGPKPPSFRSFRIFIHFSDILAQICDSKRHLSLT